MSLPLRGNEAKGQGDGTPSPLACQCLHFERAESINRLLQKTSWLQWPRRTSIQLRVLTRLFGEEDLLGVALGCLKGVKRLETYE